MNRILILTLCLLLLCGCSAPERPAPETQPPVTEAPTEPPGLYAPGSLLEYLTTGAIAVYPLNRLDTQRVIPFGSDLLLLSGFEQTTLTKLAGENLHIAASVTLDCQLSPEDPSLQVSEKGVTYFDRRENDLVFLDISLKEVSRFSLPEGVQGTPALSADRKTLYYYTADALRSIDLDSGIDRLVKQSSFQFQFVTALHWDDTVLECQVGDGSRTRHLFLSTATGALLCESGIPVTLTTAANRWFALRRDGIYEEKLTGTGSGEIRMLYAPDYEAFAFPLLAQDAVVTATTADAQVTLDYYKLSDGTHPYSITLPPGYSPAGITADPSESCVWIHLYDESLGCDVLCRWNFEKNPVSDDTVYLGDRRTADHPDEFGLDACAALAAEISRNHDVRILLWKDAVAAELDSYGLTEEYQVPVIRRSLEMLDKALSHYPAGFLKEAASELGDGVLRIALVREISKADGFDPDGVFFRNQDGNPYIWLELDSYNLEGTLYHELFHLIESRIFSKSLALDDWEKLNPADFCYDYSYLYDSDRDDRTLIEGDTRVFIDFFSMTFPREDRAAVMQYAMLEDSAHCFTAETMQQKLRAICTGIREAYGLETYEGALLWEQYLAEPIS